MEWQSVQYYSRIIMNPPFSHGQDIRLSLIHISRNEIRSMADALAKIRK